LATLAIGLASAPAVAQFGGGGGGFGRQGMAPTLNSRDLGRYADILGLDPEQREVAEVLFEGYMEEVQAGIQEFRDEMNTVREEMRSGDGGPEGWQAMGDLMEKFRERGEKLQTTMLGDIRAILTDEQAENWPRVERAVRRDQTLRRGFLSGERVDVTRLVDRLELEASVRQELDSVLVQYEIELDKALQARNRMQEDAMEEMRELMRSRDQEAMQDMIEEGRKVSARVRDVNRRYFRQIESQLGTDARARFEHAFQQASFPQVYRAQRGERVLESVLGFEDLSEDQTRSLEAVRSGYERQISAINREHAAEIEESEMNMSVRDLFRRGRGGRDRPGDEFEGRKRELDEKTLESVRQILTQEQAARMDQRIQEMRDEERDRRGRGRGRDRIN
jgi:Spy/CpxP family protein refolding chaperone